MSYTPKNQLVNFSENKTDKENKIEKFRYIERQLNWIAKDWHFGLIHFFDEPIKVYAWFRNAVKNGNIISFDGDENSGRASFEWVSKKYPLELARAYGDFELRLVSGARILKSFSQENKKSL